MPALITHYLFGEEALNRGLLPGFDEGGAGGAARRTAFLLGCQGPDPFFFAVTTPRGAAARSLAGAMHRTRVAPAFDRLRADLAKLPEADRPAGEAFVCGMLAHYALDRTAHPYVYAMEGELCDGSADLADARSEVHAVIESEIDCGVLDRYRGRTAAEFPPVGVLEGDERVVRAAGALTAELAGTVFGLPLRPADYGRALGDMRLCYRLIEPCGCARSRRIARLERAVRPHSQLASLAHRVDQGADNPSMNPGRRPWVDPFKGGASDEGFAEVFERALGDYAAAAAAYRAGEPSAGFVGGLDYSGRPMGPGEE